MIFDANIYKTTKRKAKKVCVKVMQKYKNE